jgi:guanine nucleotide-binding protein alpha-1 subunit
MDAIIFLAPISSFDERLREDRRVNRLEDTYMLWQTLCSLQMLSKTQIILFLNKCDLLEQKLRAGVKVRTYVPSFGNRSNDIETVKKCDHTLYHVYFSEAGSDHFPSDFQSHFKEIAKQHSPEQRRYYVHLTSVVVRMWYNVTGIISLSVFYTGHTRHRNHATNSRRWYLTR